MTILLPLVEALGIVSLRVFRVALVTGFIDGALPNGGYSAHGCVEGCGFWGLGKANGMRM